MNTKTFSSFPPLSSRFGSGGTTELRCRNAQAIRSRGIIMRALARRMLMDDVVPWKPLPDILGNRLLNAREQSFPSTTTTTINHNTQWNCSQPPPQQPPQQQQQQRGRHHTNSNTTTQAAANNEKKVRSSWQHRSQSPRQSPIRDVPISKPKRASSGEDRRSHKSAPKSNNNCIPIPVYHSQWPPSPPARTHSDPGAVSIQVQHVDKKPASYKLTAATTEIPVRKAETRVAPERTCDVVYSDSGSAMHTMNANKRIRDRKQRSCVVSDGSINACMSEERKRAMEEKKKLARQLLDQLLPRFPLSQGGRHVVQIPVHVRQRSDQSNPTPATDIFAPFYERAAKRRSQAKAKVVPPKKNDVADFIAPQMIHKNRQQQQRNNTTTAVPVKHERATESVVDVVVGDTTVDATKLNNHNKQVNMVSDECVSAGGDMGEIATTDDQQQQLDAQVKIIEDDVIDDDVVVDVEVVDDPQIEVPSLQQPMKKKKHIHADTPSVVSIVARLDKVGSDDDDVLKIVENNKVVDKLELKQKHDEKKEGIIDDQVQNDEVKRKEFIDKSTSTDDLQQMVSAEQDEKDDDVTVVSNKEVAATVEAECLSIEVAPTMPSDFVTVSVEKKQDDMRDMLFAANESNLIPKSYNDDDGEAAVLGLTELIKAKISGRSDADSRSVVHKPSGVAQDIPKFYFPRGKPASNADELKSTLRNISNVFTESGKERLTRRELAAVADACGLTSYWKAAIFKASVSGDDVSTVTKDEVTTMWERVAKDNHDSTSKFIAMLAKPGNCHLDFDDFLCLLLDIVECHPGLMFLREAPEFHTRYINTVVARIFYIVNRSWSGQITLSELRKSNFLQVLDLLSQENDINAITDYFSYEHFYVVYCKFWELDTDHDLVVDRLDLSRHANGALPMRLIDRLLCGAVTRWDSSDHRQGKMSYVDFVWFLISEEDKTTSTSIEYWFRCMDLDGDGFISMYEMEYFYEEQIRKLEQLEIEPLPFEDCVCQMLDMVKPALSDRISLRDLKQCKLAKIFFDTFFNIEKYLEHEQKDPFAPQKDGGDANEPSDWVRYAMEEYELLVAEEHANDQQMSLDMSYNDETDSLIKEEFAKYGIDSNNRGGGSSDGGMVGSDDFVSSSSSLYGSGGADSGEHDNNQRFTAVSNIA